MSLLIKSGGGITKLSELVIDVDKDWGNKRIIHLPEPSDGTEPSIRQTVVESKPPVGKVKVDNYYIDPTTNDLVAEG